MANETLVIPRWLKLAGVGFGLLIAAAMAFAIFEPIQVLPRIRLAPGYSLDSADGTNVTSEDGRGAVTLYSFAPTDCDDRCDGMFHTMRQVSDRIDQEVDLGDTEFRLITVALDQIDDVAALAGAAERSGAETPGAEPGKWQWIGGSESEVRAVVGAGFQRFYEPKPDGEIDFDEGFVLVDGNGVIRGEYRYSTLADDADKLIRHTEILAEEIRYRDGPASVAYEAAHLFLCYP